MGLFLVLIYPYIGFTQTYPKTINGICYELTRGSDGYGSAMVISKEGGYSGNVSIPEKVYESTQTRTWEYSVTSIGTGAFKGCSELTSIYADFVSNIQAEAFSFCSNLSEIRLPNVYNKTYSIGSEAFKGCKKITSLKLNKCRVIGYGAFTDCSGLVSITIPKSVESVGAGIFAGCTALTNIIVDNGNNKYDSRENCNAIIDKTNNNLISGCMNTVIPSSVTSIGNRAFYGCTGLTSITIPNSVTSIVDEAFSGCTGLTSVSIPNSVISIGDNAFSDTPWFKNLPDGLVYIGSVAYMYKGTMPENTHIIIKEGTQSIRGAAFQDCTGLTGITIPNSITEIEDNTFSGCTGLTSVTIPSSVTSIGTYAFNSCSALISITLNSNAIVTQTYSDRNNFSMIFGKQVKEFILNNPYKIGDYAFAGCTNMTVITLPESVTAIGKYAFYNCSSLNSITIPRLAGYIEKATFDGCSRLTKVTINSNEVCSSARYSENSSLQHVFPYATQYILGEEVEEISRYAFAGSRIQSLTVLNPMVTIDGDAFKDCDNLHNVYTNRGGTTLLGLWRSGFNTYDIKTYEQIKCPELSFQLTQTTATASVSNYYDEYKYSAYFDKSPYDYYYEEDRPEAVEIADQRYKMTGLKPGKEYDYWLEIRQGDDECMVEGVYKPIDISPSVEVIKNTPTSLYLQGSYTKGDAVFKDHRITFGRWSDAETKNGSTIIKEKLEPNTSYRVKYEVDILWGENNEKQDTYIWEGDIRTDYVWFNVLAPKVISVGNVIVASTVNIEDEDAVVGFEWRRMDWPDDIASSTGGAVLYEGMMEGYIRNMNADKLWTVRPYFISNYGNYYYGDWTGFDPSNTSYFEPTVHTYAKVTVQGNKATFKGYAMRGTDNVTEQGFKYWRVSDNVRGYEGVGVKATNIPANAQMVTASGQVMTATISNLDYSTDYCCVAFVTTSEGETFYGEQQAFRTGEDPTGISDVIISEDPEERTIVGYYNLQGQRMAEPQRGVNIIRYSDGTAKKVLLK